MPSPSLAKMQQEFAREVAALILHINSTPGYSCTLGDAYRDPRVHGKIGIKMGYGHKASCHKVRLAQDLNLFKDGVWQELGEAHRIFGEWWEARSTPEFPHTWGGRWDDGNHYSFSYMGMR